MLKARRPFAKTTIAATAGLVFRNRASRPAELVSAMISVQSGRAKHHQEKQGEACEIGADRGSTLTGIVLSRFFR